MPNVYGDKRAAMKAIDDMMKDQANQRFAPQIQGETFYVPSAMLFGHYDSRGGSFITVTTDPLSAMATYITDIFCDELNDGWSFHNALMDLIGRFEVVIIGDSDPFLAGESDLLSSYGGWYESYRLEHRWRTEDDWYKTQVLVLRYVGQHEPTDEDPEDPVEILLEWKGGGVGLLGSDTFYRLRHWELGEDACGLAPFHTRKHRIVAE